MNIVSMKSGLEGRNNSTGRYPEGQGEVCLNEVRPGRPEQLLKSRYVSNSGRIGLNEVRPGRPEQFRRLTTGTGRSFVVSMKSGLEGRNNYHEPGENPGVISVSQ